MKKIKRLLSCVMAALMIVTMLPSMIFASENLTMLDGTLGFYGIHGVGSELSAKYEKAVPGGLTDDYVTFWWSRITPDELEWLKQNPNQTEALQLKELSTEKKYTIKEEDLGYDIILIVTGREDMGMTGKLAAVTKPVVSAEEAEQLLTEEDTKAEQDINTDIFNEPESIPSDEPEMTEEIPENYEEFPENYEEENPENYEEFPENYEVENPENYEAENPENYEAENPENYEGFPENCEEEFPDNYTEEFSEEELTAVPEEPVQEMPAETENDGFEEELIPITREEVYGYDNSEENSGMMNEEPEADPVQETEETLPVFEAEATTEDLTGILDFGTIDTFLEEYQQIKVTNTGNMTLHFIEISPEHFMVQDITEPLEPGETVELWITPREGIAAGEYEDVITYSSEEGATAEVTAKVIVAGEETEPSNPENPENPEELVQIEEPQEAAPIPGLKALAPLSETKEANPVEESKNEGTPEENITPADDQTDETGMTEPEPEPAETSEPEPVDTPTPEPADTPTSEPTETPIPTPTQEPDPFAISEEPLSVNFGTLLEGYSSEDSIPKNVEVAYTCPEERDVKVRVVSDSDSFVVANQSPSEDSILDKGTGTFSFVVRLKDGLTAGSYDSLIRIYLNDNGESIKEIPVSAVIEERVVSITATPEDIDFGTMEEGYEALPEAQSFVITNTGNTTVTLANPVNDYFAFSAVDGISLDGTVLAPGGEVTVWVQPKMGLGKAEYAQEVGIYAASSGENKLTASVKVHLVVREKVNTDIVIQSITDPESITGLPNGTAKDAQSLKLPTSVVIQTSSGKMKAKVSWNVEEASYDPNSASAQSFTVSGKVKLPDGVVNTNKISLKTLVNVSVKGYDPVLADPQKNQITGITGSYTTASRINFTAVGAGSDRAEPKNGDTRFVPESWSVVNSYKWEQAPYTASFGMAKAGQYTLSVVFKQQKFNGSAWEDTGTKDTKSVPFTVTQAETTPTSVPGQSLTPAPNKNAANTGDTTPIALFVVILVAAAAAICGILVYRSKKK